MGSAAATPNPSGVTFDAPLQQGTTVNVPTGVSFDAPLTKPATVPVSTGVRGTSQPQPAQQTPLPLQR